MLVAALVFAVFRQGAYHQWQHQVFAWLTCGAGLLLIAERAGRRALVLAAVIISPLLISSLISTALSGDRSDSRSTLLEILLVAIGLAAGAAVPQRERDTVVHAVLLVAVVVAATAIYGVATHGAPWGRITAGVWRGSSSLTYANAAAAVLGPGALLGFHHAAHRSNRFYPVIACGLTIGLASTQSRAGVAATVLVGLWLIRSLGLRRFTETALPIVSGVVIGLPLLIVYASNDKETQAFVVIAAIVIGLATTALLWPLRKQIRQPVAVFGAALAVAFVVAVLGGVASSLGDRLTLRSGTTAQGEDAAVLFGDRAEEWSTAWDRVVEEPLVGHGPGVVDLRWIEEGRTFRALFVHNEYLELAVTHGILGVLALVLSAVLFHRYRRSTVTELPVLFAVAAFLIHSSFDYLWHLPALPVIFALLAGTMLDNERVCYPQR